MIRALIILASNFLFRTLLLLCWRLPNWSHHALWNQFCPQTTSFWLLGHLSILTHLFSSPYYFGVNVTSTTLKLKFKCKRWTLAGTWLNSDVVAENFCDTHAYIQTEAMTVHVQLARNFVFSPKIRLKQIRYIILRHPNSLIDNWYVVVAKTVKGWAFNLL